MKMTEILALQDADLRMQVDKLKRELFDIRFKGAVEQIPQPSRLRDVRKDIARIQTVLRSRQIAGKTAS